jgi:hypothetical protein
MKLEPVPGAFMGCLGWAWVDRCGVFEGGGLVLLKERPPPLDLASASSTKKGLARKMANNRAVNEAIAWVFVKWIMLSPYNRLKLGQDSQDGSDGNADMTGQFNNNESKVCQGQKDARPMIAAARPQPCVALA